MQLKRDVDWWYWFIVDAALVFGFSGFPLGYYSAMGMMYLMIAHRIQRDGVWWNFPIHLRTVYLLMLWVAFMCQWPWLFAAQFLGTLGSLVFDYCMLARMLSLLPWNVAGPLTWKRIWWTFFSRPVQGNILQHVQQ